MIDKWKDVYTKSQRENLIEKTVASLTELVNFAKQEVLLQDTTLGYLNDTTLSSAFVYISRKGRLMERRAFSISDKVVTEKDYERVIYQYKLTPNKIENILKPLQNK